MRSLMVVAVIAAATVGGCGGNGSDTETSTAAGGTAGAECLDGTERCPCYGNGTCNEGLVCASDLCVDLGSGGQGGAGGETSTSECAQDEKLCEGVCVSTDDTRYGCGRPTCAPCIIPYAESDCRFLQNSSMCVIAACDSGRGDCNQAASDGCETDLSASAEHCGACDAACAADEQCQDGACL